MSGIDHYEVLDIAKTATAEQIKAAHRKLARIAHPDQGGDAMQFRLVQEAYETLHDQTRRIAYDAANGIAFATEPPPAPRPAPSATPGDAHHHAPPTPAPPTPAPQTASASPPPPRQPPPPAPPAPPFQARPQTWRPRRRSRRKKHRSVAVVFRIAAVLSLCLVGLTLVPSVVDYLRGGNSANLLALWGIPAVAYAVWWLTGRQVPPLLAVLAQSYTVFMGLCAAMTAAEHKTTVAMYLAAQAASIALLPLLGRLHRRRRAVDRHTTPGWRER